MDFTNLNKACLNDSFPLLKINRLMKSTTDFEFLSTLDANSRYHQIPIHAEDKEKTYFITEERIFFYYKAMPFALKNTGATYG